MYSHKNDDSNNGNDGSIWSTRTALQALFLAALLTLASHADALAAGISGFSK